MNYSIYTTPPAGFCTKAQAAGCYLGFQDKFLLLKRHPDRPQGNTWCFPAGKLEEGETPRQGVIREIQEEVGLDIREGLQEAGHIFVRLPHVSYVYHMFYKKYDTPPEIALSLDEHLEARWVTHEEALQLPLIIACKEVMTHYQTFLV